jgi:hypothetical protein
MLCVLQSGYHCFQGNIYWLNLLHGDLVYIYSQTRVIHKFIAVFVAIFDLLCLRRHYATSRT